MEYKSSKYNFVIKNTKNEKIIFNTKSGTVSKFNLKTFQNLKNNDFSNEEYLPLLIEKGFVVNKYLNEENVVIFNEFSEILNDHSPSLQIVIAPTMNCNLKCIYCFEEGCDKSFTMDEHIQENFIEYVKNKIHCNSSLKKIHVRWFGGEPLLKVETIVNLSKKLTTLCAENNIEYSAHITTNGVLLTKDIAKKLKDCKISTCQITLDGTEKQYCYYKNATPKQFKQVIQNIIDTCDILAIEIRLNADYNNYEDLKKLTKYLLIDHNLKNKISVYLAEIKSVCENTSYSKEESLNKKTTYNLHTDFNNFLKQEINLQKIRIPIISPKKCYCSYMKHSNMVVGPDGSLYRCEHLIGQKDKVIGNCNFGLFYNNFDLNEFNYRHPKKCLNCSIFPVCLSGCRDERKHIPITKTFCDNQKEIIKQNVLLRLNMNKN